MAPLVDGRWEDARRAAFLAFSHNAENASEVVAVNNSFWRTLSSDVLALVDLPTTTTSAMDGYAVAGNGPWKLVGEVTAFTSTSIDLVDGTAVKISTGGAIPVNTYGILRWEDAKVDGTILHGSTTKDKDIRPSGTECKTGEIIASAGTTINPGLLGLISAAGHDVVHVHRKPKVVLLLSGDEIIKTGLPSKGLVRDSIGVMLPGWLERMGCEIVKVNYIQDRHADFVSALSLNVENADVIVTTGGTARGSHDHLHNALFEISADVVVDGVKVRPGHPMILAKLGGVAILGLPGNPQSAIAALMSLGQVMTSAMLGKSYAELEMVSSAQALNSPDDSTRLILGNLRSGRFEMGTHLGSGMLRGLAASSGFAIVPPGGVREGSDVGWLPLP